MWFDTSYMGRVIRNSTEASVCSSTCIVLNSRRYYLGWYKNRKVLVGTLSYYSVISGERLRRAEGCICMFGFGDVA